MHTCDNRKCYNPDHLNPGTYADNQADMASKGRSASGERNARAKLTGHDVECVRVILNLGFTQKEIGHMFNVSQSQISHIKCGTAWR